MPLAAIQVDDSRWPLVVMRLPIQLSVHDVEIFNSSVVRWLERKERFGIVVDASGTTSIRSLHRKTLAHAAREHTEQLRLYCVAWGVVVTSPTLRGVATAIAWAAPPPMPLKLFATTAAAENWVRSKLQ